MIPRTAACFFVVALLAAAPARAQERDTYALTVTANASDSAVLPTPVPLFAPAQQKRPLTLSALYGTFATLQVLDVVSTQKAKSAGAQEMNPMMGGTGLMIAMKASTSALSIYLVEQTWKKNRTAAIITMVAINGMTAAVAAHNFRTAKR
jgi:hypothetical protein